MMAKLGYDWQTECTVVMADMLCVHLGFGERDNAQDLSSMFVETGLFYRLFILRWCCEIKATFVLYIKMQQKV